MKKFLTVLTILFILLYCVLMVNYQINRKAEYIFDAKGSIDAIKYNDIIYEPIDRVDSPYKLVVDANATPKGKVIYISRNDYGDVLLPWGDNFVYYSDEFDYQGAFIRVFPYDNLYVKANFVYPKIENNVVNEVWMSHSSSYEIIKDEATVDKIVACAKSDGKIKLDEDIVDYIKKYSWDYHCFYLKYEGYPIVEEFQIEETEDGRYIISQYDVEDYYRLSREDEAHQ